MALEMLISQHNPDVLSCLANLSSDEVFTPPSVVNQMLDMLPQEMFCNPDITFLDPGTKSGVFLREIAKRLIVGLEKQIPDIEERVNHILRKQLFGIATTQLTSLLARRSLYCSKYPNSNFSVVKFDTSEGNIRFRRIEHRWQDGRCKYCGASKDQYDRGDTLETHAYEFIHSDVPEEIMKMKFDVIVSNPPYQLSDGGNNASAVPIYNFFVEGAKKLKPRYLTMIIPSRWYAGGRGLDKFRDGMLRDKHIKALVDFSNADDCFPGVDISGGVCYFLWDRDYEGPCSITNVEGEVRSTAERSLDQFPILIRSNVAVNIVKKVLSHNETALSNSVSSQRPFGLRTYARPDKKGELTLRWNGGKGPLQRDKITAGQDLIDKWNVIVSRVFFEHGGKTDKNGQNRVLSILEILKPKEVCTETYVVIKSFDNEEQAMNLYAYLQTKFARYLILQATSSIMISKNAFSFVPEQDFSLYMTDSDLYQKYELTEDEIAIIEKTIRPMESSGGDE